MRSTRTASHTASPTLERHPGPPPSQVELADELALLAVTTSRTGLALCGFSSSVDGTLPATPAVDVQTSSSTMGAAPPAEESTHSVVHPMVHPKPNPTTP